MSSVKPDKISFKFPRKFLWGASTSAHQVEGNTSNQWSAWELDNAKSLATSAPYHYQDSPAWQRVEAEAKRPDNYVSGAGAGHYQHYQTDFDLLTKMNMNAFRFSVEWSRIEPTEGGWSVEAIDYYKRYVRELKQRDIEPVLTLFHFTLPAWFADKGGFSRQRNLQYFVRFVEKIVSELGIDIRYIITLNEPQVYARESYLEGHWPPNLTSRWQYWRVLNNLAQAHKQSAKAIRSINRRYKVSVAKNSSYVYAGDDAWLSRASANFMQYFKDDYWMGKVARHCDFLGVNYYFSDRVYGYRVHNPEDELSDLGWDLSPVNIQHALERLHDKYKLPIMITENGLADGEDELRQWWLSQTLLGMQRAIDNKVELIGYLHWSLIDNFEWDKGFWPRFGLVEVDYATGKRSLRPSARWFGKVIKYLREAK